MKKFQEVNKAYDTLRDPQKRQQYDHLGADNFERMEQGGGPDPGQVRQGLVRFGGGPAHVACKNLRACRCWQRPGAVQACMSPGWLIRLLQVAGMGAGLQPWRGLEHGGHLQHVWHGGRHGRRHGRVPVCAWGQLPTGAKVR